MLNNKIIGVDTDAIIICKPDQSEWSDEEQTRFIQHLNKRFPEKINFDHDGYYDSILVVASKNYVMKERGEEDLKIKGSGLKDQKKEPAIKEMIDRFIEAFIYDRQHEINDIYHEYVHEVMNITDIARWSAKKTVTEAIMRCQGHEFLTKEEKVARGITRSTEPDLWDAIKGEELVQLGDKFYVFPAIVDVKTEVKQYKNGKTKEKLIPIYGNLQPKFWNGQNHDKSHLLKRLYDTLAIFELVLHLDSFTNYALVKNYNILLDKYA